MRKHLDNLMPVPGNSVWFQQRGYDPSALAGEGSENRRGAEPTGCAAENVKDDRSHGLSPQPQKSMAVIAYGLERLARSGFSPDNIQDFI